MKNQIIELNGEANNLVLSNPSVKKILLKIFIKHWKLPIII